MCSYFQLFGFIGSFFLIALQLFFPWGRGGTQGAMHMWGSEDNPRELVLSLHHVGLRDGT